MAIQWDSIETPKNKSSQKSGSICFLTTKNCPITLTPYVESGLEKYEEVYDAVLRRSRRPDKGESSRLKYAFKAIVKDNPDSEMTPKVCIAGPQITKQIQTAISAAKAMSDGEKVPVIEVSSLGTGRDTEYVCKTLGAISTEKFSKYKVELDEMDTNAVIIALLDGKKDEEEKVVAASESQKDDSGNFGFAD